MSKLLGSIETNGNTLNSGNTSVSGLPFTELKGLIWTTVGAVCVFMVFSTGVSIVKKLSDKIVNKIIPDNPKTMGEDIATVISVIADRLKQNFPEPEEMHNDNK